MQFDVIHGDSLSILRSLPSESAQCVVTSPPYYGLRDYGTARWDYGNPNCDHRQQLGGEGDASTKQGTSVGTQAFQYRDKCQKCGALRIDNQIGLEKDPNDYIAKMVCVFAEVGRVLRNDGTLWLNIGDSYFSSKGYQIADSIRGKGSLHDGLGSTAVRPGFPSWAKPKCRVGIPHRLVVALCDGGWTWRDEIIWSKPAPMVSSVEDRTTSSHEFFFMLTKGPRYLYDQKAIKEPATTVVDDPGWDGLRNRRSVWTIHTESFSDATGRHHAVMPQRLVEPAILAGSRPGDLVLDPFCGSGTTGIVALRHGRTFLGIELNEKYAAMARRRIAGPLFSGGEGETTDVDEREAEDRGAGGVEQEPTATDQEAGY